MKTIFLALVNIVALYVLWNMALDRLIAHCDRWQDKVDDLLKERS